VPVRSTLAARDAAGGLDAARVRGSRMLTGLTLVAIGGLLWLAGHEHAWARELVRDASPLLILVVACCIAMIVTDRDDVVGKLGIAAGVGLLFMARLDLVPEPMLRTLGIWAFVLVGAALAISGLRRRARTVDEGTVAVAETNPQSPAPAYAQVPHPAFGRYGTERQRAKAS
jgi:hypothetical protein